MVTSYLQDWNTRTLYEEIHSPTGPVRDLSLLKRDDRRKVLNPMGLFSAPVCVITCRRIESYPLSTSWVSLDPRRDAGRNSQPSKPTGATDTRNVNSVPKLSSHRSCTKKVSPRTDPRESRGTKLIPDRKTQSQKETATTPLTLEKCKKWRVKDLTVNGLNRTPPFSVRPSHSNPLNRSR